MKEEEFHARSRTALAAQALSICEHFVMCSVGCRVNLEPAALLRNAAGCSTGDPRGTFTEDEYRDALASCIHRGLLKVLGSDDFDPDGHRKYLRDTPLATEDGFTDYAPGQVEFTAAGYRIHQAVVQSIFGWPAYTL